MFNSLVNGVKFTGIFVYFRRPYERFLSIIKIENVSVSFKET